MSVSAWAEIRSHYESGNMAAALAKLKALAAVGDTDALSEIGHLYEIGGGGVEQDFEQARHWYERAAKHSEPQAYLALGRFYFSGIGVEQDYEKARRFFEKCAQSIPGAPFALGMMYHLGLGVPTDMEVARRHYESAVAKGHVLAIKHLGLTEIHSGRLFVGFWHVVTGILRFLVAYLRNPEDRRLRIG